MAEKRNIQLFHCHSIISSRKYRPWFFKHIILPGRQFILHYHGGDIRKVPTKMRRWFETHAAAVCVSTPDLLEFDFYLDEEPILLDTMFDETLFRPADIPTNNNGLCILKAYQSADKTLDILTETGHGDVNWQFIRRKNYAAPIGIVPVLFNETSHDTMPHLLGRYEWYADISMDDDRVMDARSITGIEAANMGVKVVDVHGKVYGSEIAIPHRSGTVIPKYQKLYQEIVEQHGF